MKNKIVDILLIILCIINLFGVYGFAMMIFTQDRYAMEVLPYEDKPFYTYSLYCEYETNAEIKRDLDKLFNAGGYIYREAKLSTDIGAGTNLVFRLITMNTDYVHCKYVYTFCLAHELTHLKYYSANECFTEYTAIKTLYESGNEYFKNVALWRATYVIQNNLQDEYDCGYYLQELLRKE